MSLSPDYVTSVRELLTFVPELSIRKMFGGAIAAMGDLTFALLDDDELWLKADAQSQGRFEAEGLEQFTYPMRDGRRMTMAYWRAPAEVWDNQEVARMWVELALRAASRAKAARPAKKPKPPKAPKPGTP